MKARTRSIRHPLQRRAFLRGCGALLPLPLLELAGSRRATAADPRPPHLGIFYFPNGGAPGDWVAAPDGSGRPIVPDFLGPELARLADDLVWINGLDNNVSGRGGHETAAGTFLTASDMNPEGPSFRRSADQILADQIGESYPFRSLVLSADGFQLGSSCCHDIEIALNHISWVGGTTPATKVQHPKALFDLMFGDPSLEGQQGAEERIARKLSVLDFNRRQVELLQRKIGAVDRERLDAYFESVREVERKLELLEPGVLACDRPSTPAEDLSFEDQNEVMLDLIVLAFSCDLTPVVSFMMDFEFSARLLAIEGVKSGHHGISHHENDPNKIEQLRRINAFYARRFAGFVERMKAVLDENGEPLLDNSLLVFGSGISDGNAHNRSDLPIVVAGKAGGQIETGRVIDTNKHLATLWRTVMKIMGASGEAVDGFGNDSGELGELTG